TTTATSLYTLPLHDALPIFRRQSACEGTLREQMTPSFIERGPTVRVPSEGLTKACHVRVRPHLPAQCSRPSVLPAVSPGNQPGRSEEHTSELQSRVDLVCRL